ISGIAAYDPLSGQRIQSFEPYMAGTAGGFAIAGTTDGCVWTAGGYTAVGTPGNQLAGRDLVRLCDEAGPGPAPTPSPTPPAPTSCVATVVGTTVTITWTTPPLAESTIVHRQVGVNGTYSWRARVSSPTSTFTENAPTGEITTYQVTARYPGLLYSEPVTCAPPIDLTAPVVDDVLPPASCHATNNGTAATITWTPSDNATDYRAYRTIDGSPNYWRGLTTNTSFDDTLRTSGTHPTPSKPEASPASGPPPPNAHPVSSPLLRRMTCCRRRLRRHQQRHRRHHHLDPPDVPPTTASTAPSTAHPRLARPHHQHQLRRHPPHQRHPHLHRPSPRHHRRLVHLHRMHTGAHAWPRAPDVSRDEELVELPLAVPHPPSIPLAIIASRPSKLSTSDVATSRVRPSPRSSNVSRSSDTPSGKPAKVNVCTISSPGRISWKLP
ncbi:MAG: hypothetical protein R2710_15375, partial [Acidimicrobiales bacterium]